MRTMRATARIIASAAVGLSALAGASMSAVVAPQANALPDGSRLCEVAQCEPVGPAGRVRGRVAHDLSHRMAVEIDRKVVPFGWTGGKLGIRTGGPDTTENEVDHKPVPHAVTHGGEGWANLRF